MNQNNVNAITILIQEVGQRLFERLDFLKISTGTVLNLGKDSEAFTPLLQTKYPPANVVSLNLTQIQIPLKNQSVDCIFSNGLLEWSTELPGLLAEIKRVLKPDGCLLFSTFGPDTPSNIPLLDMHDIGDALLEFQFSDPVMDAEYIQVNNLSFEVIYGLAWNTHNTKIPIKII